MTLIKEGILIGPQSETFELGRRGHIIKTIEQVTAHGNGRLHISTIRQTPFATNVQNLEKAAVIDTRKSMTISFRNLPSGKQLHFSWQEEK